MPLVDVENNEEDEEEEEEEEEEEKEEEEEGEEEEDAEQQENETQDGPKFQIEQIVGIQQQTFLELTISFSSTVSPFLSLDTIFPLACGRRIEERRKLGQTHTRSHPNNPVQDKN